MCRHSLWVIEDNDLQREHIVSLLESSAYAPQFDITALSGAVELKDKLVSSQTPNILLTDIELGDEAPSGVDLAEALFSPKKTQIIYITGHLDLVTSAYRTRHVCLLAKPIKPEQLDMALGKAIAAIEQENRENLAFSFGSGVIKLPTAQILWLESAGHRVEIHAFGCVRETYDSLCRLIEMLPATFVRTHKSYVANLAHAEELTQSELVMTDGSRIPVSRKYRREVHDAFMDYLGLQA